MQQSAIVRRGDRVQVTVERLAFEGPGVARIDGGVDSEGKPRKLVVFIDGVAVGDEVEIELFAIKRGLARGRVRKFLKRSAARVEPRCPHFGIPVDSEGVPQEFLPEGGFNPQVNCGGCSWQFLSYEDQLRVKNELVRDALIRVGGFETAELDAVWQPIMASEAPWYYRNKMDFSFVRDRDDVLHLGLHMKGRYRDVTEIRSCELFRPWVGGLLEAVRSWAAAVARDVDGDFQSMVVRAATNTGEVMVNLIVENANFGQLGEEFASNVRNYFDSLSGQTDDHLVSVYLTNIFNKKGQRKRFDEQLLWGKPVFNEQLRIGERTLRFEVAPGAFLQPNTKQAELFYALVTELAGLGGRERVFDVFCGTGTIGICLAEKTTKVTGLELSEAAVENARRNAVLNGVANIDFVVGDATKLLPELGAAVDLVIVDPPRAGVTEKVIEAITATAARRLIYVSCNPPTLARDLKLLAARGWRLKFVQPIDQFSQTYHVETVTMLTRE